MKTLCFLLALPCLAQAPPPAAPPTFSQVADRSVAGMERNLVALVEAMPEAKFAYAPTAGEFKGVKTFGQQVRHVAAANYMFASGILGEKPPVDPGGDDGPETLKTKAEIVKFLKDSFVYVHKAMATLNEKNAVEPIEGPWGGTTTRLALLGYTVGHMMDHYGQLVVYLRMNGLIPPASRKS